MTGKIGLSLFFIAIFIALISSVGAVTLNSYLSTYIPNSVIANATFYYNQSLSGNTYTIMQLTGSNRYIIIQSVSSSNYAMITSPSIVSQVLTPFLYKKYYPNAQSLNSLNTSMRAFQAYGAKNIS